MNTRRRLLIVFLALCLGIYLSSYKIAYEKVLVVENVKKNTEINIPIPNRTFALSFIHSVQKTPVYEYFYISDDNTLILEKTKYFSLGVGLPFTEEHGSFANEDGTFIVNLNREFDVLPIRISPIPEHNLTIGNKTYPLTNFAEPENLLNFRAKDKITIKNTRERSRMNE
mgnify:CR=1 FL=1